MRKTFNSGGGYGNSTDNIDEVIVPANNAKTSVSGAVFTEYGKLKLLRIRTKAIEQLTKGTYYVVGNIVSDKRPIRDMAQVVWNGTALSGILLSQSGDLSIKPLTENISVGTELVATFIYLTL